MTEAIQAMECTWCGWYCNRCFADILCISSLNVWFESHTGEHLTLIQELMFYDFELEATKKNPFVLWKVNVHSNQSI